ncbi:MAG: hypothetical protein Kow0037_17980 [Calditrichia bacterium]
MPCKTQDIKKYLEFCDNMYEPVIIVAKRARQINEEQFQKKRDKQILEELDGAEVDEALIHTEDMQPEFEEPYEPEENPIVVAQREFLEGKVKFRYE